MIGLLKIAFGWVVFIWLFWSIFVMVMGFYRARLSGRLTGIPYVLALPWLWIGLAIDFVANITIAALIFLDMPNELTVTARLKRYIKTETGWRFSTAMWICDNLLDVFDPKGEHC